jgi:hypothetical protein
MAVRRGKKRAPRRKRTFSINLLETGAGLAFLDAANAGTAAQQMIGGNLKGGLETLSAAFKTNKNDMIKIGAGTVAAKLVLGSLGGSKVLGAIGPLKLRA